MNVALLLSLVLSGNAFMGSHAFRENRGSPPPYLNMPLNVPGAYTSGTTVLDTRGAAITCTRNSNATYVDSGVIKTAGVNQCRVEPSGLLVEEARTNYTLRSEAIVTGTTVTSPWAAEASGTTLALSVVTAINPNGVSGPVSRAVFGAITGAGQDSIIYQNIGVHNPAISSVYFKTETGTATVYFNSAVTYAGMTACSVTTAWSRCFSASVLTGNVYFTIGPDSRTGSGQPTSQPGVTVLIWGAQGESGAFATSYIPTAGTAVQRLADVVSIATPAAWNIATSWYATATVTPENSRVWGTTAYAFALGTNAAANTFSTYDAAAILYDNTATSLVYNLGTMPIPPYTGTKLTVCDGTVPIGVYVSGVLKTPSGGVGTGVLSSRPETLYLGAKSDGTNQFNGNISKIQIGRGCKP